MGAGSTIGKGGPQIENFQNPFMHTAAMLLWF